MDFPLPCSITKGYHQKLQKAALPSGHLLHRHGKWPICRCTVPIFMAIFWKFNGGSPTSFPLVLIPPNLLIMSNYSLIIKPPGKRHMEKAPHISFYPHNLHHVLLVKSCYKSCCLVRPFDQPFDLWVKFCFLAKFPWKIRFQRWTNLPMVESPRLVRQGKPAFSNAYP